MQASGAGNAGVPIEQGSASPSSPAGWISAGNNPAGMPCRQCPKAAIITLTRDKLGADQTRSTVRSMESHRQDSNMESTAPPIHWTFPDSGYGDMRGLPVAQAQTPPDAGLVTAAAQCALTVVIDEQGEGPRRPDGPHRDPQRFSS